MTGGLTFEADRVPDAPAERRGSGLIAWVGGLTLALFAGVAWSLVDHGYRARIVGELAASVFGHSDGLQLSLMDSLGQAVTIATLVALRVLPGADTAALPALTAVAGAAFLAGLAHLLDRQGWPTAQIFAVVVAVALNAVFLKATTSGATVLLGGLAFFTVVYTCERLEHVGDVQAQMNVGLVLAANVLVNPAAVYVLIPVLTAIPVLYRDIRSPAAAVAGYLMVVLPLLTVLAAFVFLHLIFSADPLLRPFQLWASPLHGAVDVIERYDWPLTFGGAVLEPAGMLALAALACVPGFAVLVWRFLRARAERASPGTAVVALAVPVLAGTFATTQVHTRSAWPWVLAALMAFLVWLATKPLPNRVRMIALAALFLGAGMSWIYPPLWAERGAAAWRTALLRGVPPASVWPETPATASWFDPRFTTRLLHQSAPEAARQDTPDKGLFSKSS